MAEFFGDLERIAADLYPYRWAIAAGVLVALAAFAAFAYRNGWHEALWRRRRVAVIIGAPLLALAVYIGWDLGSPLFTNKTVEEEFPFAFAAIVPEETQREAVEKVMAVLADIDQEPVKEPMPKEMMVDESIDQTSEKAEGEANAATAPTETGPVELKAGSFRDQDSFHKGSGQATIYRGPDGSHLLRLDDFKVTNGPDLHILLSSHPDPKGRNELKGTEYFDLGKLKGNIGSQNYPIPDDLDIAAQMSVVIYCMPFHVMFSVAPLKDTG